MTKLSLDLEIAQTLGIPVALIISLAERENISNLEELKSIALRELSFLDADEVAMGINTINKFNLLKPIHA